MTEIKHMVIEQVLAADNETRGYQAALELVDGTKATSAVLDSTDAANDWATQFSEDQGSVQTKQQSEGEPEG